ncbi:g1493 [Coccomyxa elongata]
MQKDESPVHQPGARAKLSVELGKCCCVDSGEARIRQLGYKQELRRNFGLLSNASIGFTAISILTGITASFGVGYNNGGPVSIVWGWVLVSIMSLSVAACMAEITSSLPISGGPYYWSVELTKGTKLSSAFAGWFTGWLNLLGQVALTASVDSCLANQIAAIWVIYNGHVFQQEELLLCYAVCLVTHGFLNMMSARWMARFMLLSGAYQLVASVVVIALIPSIAPTHQSADFVFRTFNTSTSTSGAPSSAYLFILGMLMSQYTITGYDVCGHVSEETKNADRTSPWGIIMAVGTSVVLGFGYILALLFSIQDVDTLNTGRANGYVSGQIYYDVVMARYGDVRIAVAIMALPAMAMFFCGASCVTSNSRMLWSFSRDGGIPFHQLWSAINEGTQTPILSVWAMVTFAFLLGLPMLHSTSAFQAVTSICSIGLYISYAIPILMRIINNRRFEPGPFNLGRFGAYIGSVAVIWVVFITVAFVLPTTYPVTRETLNYSGVAVGIVMVGAVLVWFLPSVGARHWYRGENKTYKPEADQDIPPMTPKSSRYSHHSHHSMSSAGSRGLLKSTRLTLLDLIAQYRHSQNRYSTEAPSQSDIGCADGGGTLGSPKAAAALPVRPARGGAPSARVADGLDPAGFSAPASPPWRPPAFPARPQQLQSTFRSLSG